MKRLRLPFALGLSCAVGAVSCSDKAPTAQAGCFDNEAGPRSLGVSLGTPEFTIVSGATTTTTVNTNSSTSTTVTDSGPPGTTTTTMVDAGTTTTTTSTTNMPTFFVQLHVSATFSCPVEGVAHATLSTSAGQFTAGAASSAGGGGGDGGGGGGGGGSGGGGSSGGGASSSTGAAGTSITLLLTGQNGLSFDGYTTLQLIAPRSATVQAVVGDQSTCEVFTGDPVAGTVTSTACSN